MDALERLRRLRHIALDLDGTIYKGGQLFSGTLPFLRLLARLGLGHTWVTNNSSRSTQEYVARLRRMNIAAEAADIYSSTHATIAYLKREMPGVRRLFVLGTRGLRGELADNGYALRGEAPDDPPDAVVVGFDTGLTFDRLCRAAYWISEGKTFVATHPDRVCPTDERTVLVDCGSICAALTQATGRAPVAVPGKPDRRLLDGVMERRGLDPVELAMVGDRLYTDIAMARRAGVLGVLVLTGETAAEGAGDGPDRPDLVVEDLAELGRLLERARRNDP